ncbi:hypothetical protein Taro_006560 [Colocasia esculenta]|uniref:Uncharacterized protein n=1 Tax=Colocasia esculenta TaxID=4460 RepID=A0A843TVQ4_COLES|nr:hypothetical protein [Colocasia esculenta]
MLLEESVQVREDIDDPVFDPTDTTWAEGILDGDEPRDPEFRVPAKRPRESLSKEKQPEIVEDTEEQLEPARYSESDSRPVTPRMVKPPPSLRRTMSGIYMTERANAVARDDPAIEKMKQIYVRRTPKGKGKELHTKTQGEMATSSEKKKESKTRRRRLVSYTSEDNDDDDDDDDDPSATAGATTGGGIYTQSQSDYGHDSQGDYYGHDSQGKYGHDSQGQYGQDSQGHYGHHLGYGHYAHEPEFQFQPLPANSNYDSVSSSHARDSSPYSDSGFLSIQQPFTPRGIQRGMNDLATSLFGYSEYSEYKNPLYGFQGQQPYDEGEEYKGFKWYGEKLKVDEDGDVADEFLDEVLPEEVPGTDNQCVFPTFKINYSTRPAAVKKQIFASDGIVRQGVEHRGRLQWV